MSFGNVIIFGINRNIAVFVLIIFTNKFFPNFSLSESSLSCPGLLTCGLTRRLILIFRFKLLQMRAQGSGYGCNEKKKVFLWTCYVNVFYMTFSCDLGTQPNRYTNEGSQYMVSEPFGPKFNMKSIMKELLKCFFLKNQI
jgi:hypothetical protein